MDFVPQRGAAAAAAERPDGPAMPERLIVPTKHRVALSEIWSSFPVARVTGARDMKIKYKQSALGPVWLVIQPLAMLGAVAIAFAGVTKVKTGGVPYLLFALAGLSVWIYFQQSVSTAPTLMPNNYQVVRRSPCPRIALVVGNLLAQLPPLGILLAITFAGALFDRGLPVQALLFPVVIVWLLLFTGAVTLVLASVAARFRDAVAIVPLIIQGGIFASPVGYPISGTHGVVSVLLKLNPISGLIEAMRWSLLGVSPSALVLAIGLAWTIALLGFSWMVFGRLEVRFADYV